MYNLLPHNQEASDKAKAYLKNGNIRNIIIQQKELLQMISIV